MLTAYQCAIGAYVTEDMELLCEQCFQSEDVYAKPVPNYGLDEWQSSNAEGAYDWDYADQVVDDEAGKFALFGDEWHGEDCGCEPALYDANGHELLEAFVDTYSCPIEREDAS